MHWKPTRCPSLRLSRRHWRPPPAGGSTRAAGLGSSWTSSPSRATCTKNTHNSGHNSKNEPTCYCKNDHILISSSLVPKTGGAVKKGLRGQSAKGLNHPRGKPQSFFSSKHSPTRPVSSQRRYTPTSTAYFSPRERTSQPVDCLVWGYLVLSSLAASS